MPDNLNIVIQFVLIVVLGIVTLLLMRMSKTLRKEKRISRFSIDSINEKSVSFFDKVERIYSYFVSFFSKFLKKIKIFDTYSKKYKIYVDQTKIIRNDAMDFISHKILIGICFTTCFGTFGWLFYS